MPRLLYVVTEDWYFLSHRLPMARAALANGFEVHVGANMRSDRAAIAREGFVAHDVPFARGALSPRASLATIRALRSLYRTIRPDVIHHVALQPVVLGSLAATGLQLAQVNALTGLGHAFTADSGKGRLTGGILRAVMRRTLNRPSSIALVQNPDDANMVRRLGIALEHIVLIPGSGVDLERLQPLSEPSGAPTIGFVGRLLDDKGVRVLVAAHRLLRARGIAADLLIAGTPDPANPTSISEDELANWRKEPGITLLGHVLDISTVWARAHIAVLPSRREGLPKSLLEAAACGRPLVATDVPGCREIAIEHQTGLLVPPDNPQALADALATLATDPLARKQYGAHARQLAERRFSADAIGRATVDLYRRLVDKAHR